MPWVRVDDAFYDHPKWIEAGPLAGWLGMCALAWCNRNQTDGVIPHGKVQLLADFTMHAEIDEKEDPTEIRVEGWRVSPYALAERLVDCGLWERADGGFLIHDYLRYQKSAAEIREIAVKRAESGRKGGLSKPIATDEAAPEQPGSKQQAKVGAQPQPQDLSIDKSNLRTEPYADDFDAWWAVYPRKIDKQPALKTYIARRRAGDNPDDLLAAAKHYAEACDGQEREHIKYAKTFLNGPWLEWVDGNPEPPPSLEALVEPSPRPEPKVCPLELCGGTGYVDVPGKNAAAPCRCRTMKAHA